MTSDGKGPSRQRTLLEVLRARTRPGAAHDENGENGENGENDQGGNHGAGGTVDDPIEYGADAGGEDRGDEFVGVGRSAPPTTAKRRKPSLVTSILDRARYSRFCPWSERVLRSKQMAMYDTGSSSTPLWLCGTLGLRKRTTAAEVDAIGELLVVGCAGGHVLVNDIQSILEASETGDVKKIEPGLHLQTGDAAAVNTVRWNPTNQNEIAMLSRSGRFAMYDINHTRGEPSRKIPLPQSKLLDAVYFPSSSVTGGGRYCVAVADDRQGVLLYDAREYSNGKPVCILKSDSQRYSGARCVNIVDHGRMVLAGGGRDLEGYMNMWDLRNVSGNVAVTFSAAPNKHQHLRRLCFKTQLSRVHGLIDESRFIPCTYPEFFRPDPASYHRVGVTMRCGWSAVLDLGRLELSHVHAPPARHAPSENWMDAMQEMDEAILTRVAGDAGRVVLPHETMSPDDHPGRDGVYSNNRVEDKDVIGGCWLGESFVVPSATMDKTVHMVDFSGPCRSIDDDDEIDAPSAVQLGVSHDAVGVVKVPSHRGDALISYGTDGTFHVLQRM